MDKLLLARIKDQVLEMSQSILWTKFQLEEPKLAKNVWESALKMIDKVPNIMKRDGFFESIEVSKLNAMSDHYGPQKQKVEGRLISAITKILEEKTK